MKVGVLVVAYNAETTLRWVLDRIPSPLRSELVEVLVMDDHSGDAHVRRRPRVHRRRCRHPADDRAARGQPRLRRQPEGRLPLRHRSRLGHRGPAARRRSVRAGDDARSPRAVRRRRRRCGVRLAHARPGRGPPRRDAAVQVRRQPHPDPHPERDRRRPAERVALGLPRLPGVGAGRPAVRRQQRRVRLRHRDHPAAARCRIGGSSRCRSPRTTATRSRASTASPTPATSCSTRSATASGEVGFGARRPRAQGRALRVQAVAGQFARHRARTRSGRRSLAGARRRVRARLGRRRTAPPRASRHGGRPARRRGRDRADRPLLRGRPRTRSPRRGREAVSTS